MYIDYNKLLLPFHLASELASEVESKEREACRYGYKKAGNMYRSAFLWTCSALFRGFGGIFLVGLFSGWWDFCGCLGVFFYSAFTNFDPVLV